MATKPVPIVKPKQPMTIESFFPKRKRKIGREAEASPPKLKVSKVEPPPQQKETQVAFRATSSSAMNRYLAAEKKSKPATFTSYVRKAKTFMDPIYDRIEIPAAAVAIMDTPQFQRLRKLKQLGLCYSVYPGACHNRWEHCIGVCYLAGRLLHHLRKKQPALFISDRDILCVQLAGLCHDIGHGPYSHVFDNVLIPIVAPKSTWTHEEGGCIILDYLLQSNGINLADYGLRPDEDVAFIKELILGVKDTERRRRDSAENGWPRQRFLYDIINNGESGLDVDRMDYYRRDCYYAGLQREVVYDSLLDQSLVLECVDGQQRICFPEKLYDAVYHFFRARFELHQTMYQHRVVKALEYMLTDALVMAHPYFRIRGTDGKMLSIAQAIYDPIAFTNLNDSITDLIRNSERAEMDSARAMLDRIDRRDLYYCVGKVPMPHGMVERIASGAGPTRDQVAEQIASFSSSDPPTGRFIFEDSDDDDDDDEKEEKVVKNDNGPARVPSMPLRITKDDIIVEFMKVHHGKKEKNPVDYIHFYHKIDAQHGIKATEDDVARCRKEMREAMDKGNDERVKELAIAISDMKRSKRGEDALPPIAAPVSSTKYSATLPITFIERSIRIFCKHRKLCAVASDALRKWSRENNVSSPTCSFSQEQARDFVGAL
eukprot:g2918.t1